MKNHRRRMFMAPLPVCLAVLGGWIILVHPFASASSPSPAPASQAQIETFKALIQRYRRLLFDATVSGNGSQLVSVLYNDPSAGELDKAPDCRSVIDKYKLQIDAILSHAQIGPVGTGNGVLSCDIADVTNFEARVAAWSNAKATAAAQGRQATSADLPTGMLPAEPHNESQWHDMPVYVFNATLAGEDHATVKVGYAPDTANFVNMMLTRVNGQWYISAIWSSGEAP